MATLSAMIDTLPVRIQRRYGYNSNQQFVVWLNDGLRELEREGVLPEISKETGVEIENDFWITKPDDFRRALLLENPQEPQIKYAIQDVNDKLKLSNRMTFEKDGETDAVTAFSAQTATGVTVDIDSKEEDEFKNNLLVITAGNLAGNTYVIIGNSASAGGVTAIEYLHPLDSAWVGADATAGYIVGKDYWLLLKYYAKFTDISADSDEIPIDDAYESMLKAWIQWKAVERSDSVSNETMYWKNEWKSRIEDMRAEKSSINSRKVLRGKRLAGLEQNIDNRYTYTHRSDQI